MHADMIQAQIKSFSLQVERFLFRCSCGLCLGDFHQRPFVLCPVHADVIQALTLDSVISFVRFQCCDSSALYWVGFLQKILILCPVHVEIIQGRMYSFSFPVEGIPCWQGF